MAKYISLFTYSADSMKAMVGRPQDRAAAAAKLVKANGGRLECFYWMLGAHDGVFIAEYPDAVSAAACSAVVGAWGSETDRDLPTLRQERNPQDPQESQGRGVGLPQAGRLIQAGPS